MHTALTTTDAFRILESNDIDVVFADQRMPHMNGTEFLNRVTESGYRARRAIITGYQNDDKIQAAIRSRTIQAVFEKPYDAKKVQTFIDAES